MTILIKGMEMPKNCFCCPMSHFEGEKLFCCRLNVEVLRRKVDSDCPLIEIPPHGRLIDADEAIKDRVSNDPVVISLKCEPTIIEAEVEE